MNSVQKFNIALPVEVAAELEEKVRSGEFDSVQDALIEGAHALLQRDAEIDHWLRHEVVAGHAEYLADPSAAVAADILLDRIKDRRASRQAP